MDGEIGELDGDAVAFYLGSYFDVAHVVKDDLVFFYRPAVKDFTGNVLGGELNAFAFGFIADVGEESHFKFKGENVYPSDVVFATLENDVFDKDASDRQVDGPYGH